MKTFYNKSALEIGHQSYGESNLFLKLKTNYKLDIRQGHIPMLSGPFSSVLNLGDSISADHSLVRNVRPQAPFSRTFLRHHPELGPQSEHILLHLDALKQEDFQCSSDIFLIILTLRSSLEMLESTLLVNCIATAHP